MQLSLQSGHEIKHHLLKPEAEVLVTHVLQAEVIKDQAARLGKWQSSKQREKSWAFVPMQLTSLPLAECSLLVEPA